MWVFPMTPIHHTFEKKGMKENDIVLLFYLIGITSGIISLLFAIWQKENINI